MKLVYKRYLRLLNECTRDVTLTNLDVTHSMRETVRELMNIKDLLVKRRQERNLLVKLGLACLAFPEPVVSNIIGGALISLGYCMRKVQENSDLGDMLEAIRELKYSLSNSLHLMD